MISKIFLRKVGLGFAQTLPSFLLMYLPALCFIAYMPFVIQEVKTQTPDLSAWIEMGFLVTQCAFGIASLLIAIMLIRLFESEGHDYFKTYPSEFKKEFPNAKLEV